MIFDRRSFNKPAFDKNLIVCNQATAFGLKLKTMLKSIYFNVFKIRRGYNCSAKESIKQ